MAETVVTKVRPKYLNVVQIRLPLPGLVSIFHRVSGAGLFLCIPLLIWLFGASLGSQEQVDSFRAVYGNPLVKLLLLGLVWAYMHHFCAGIRFLLLDLHVGIELQPARRSAAAVFIVSLVLTALIGVLIW